MFTLHVSPIYHPTTTLYNTTCPRVSIQALHLKPQFLVGRWGQQKRGSVPCCLGSDGSNRDENRGSNSGGNDSKTVLDAFFLGKAFAETLNERVESTVGEILSVVGQWQAEQQKQIADFQEEVVERAQRDKEKTAIEAMDESKPSSSSSDSTFSGRQSSPVQKASSYLPLFISPKRLRERYQSSEMVSKRQKEARKVYKAANPHLFPKPVEKDPSSIITTKKKKKNGRKKKKSDPTKSSLGANPVDGVGKIRNKNPLRKHPLRVPGMKPGESCFICKGMDHIAKLCPKKSDWERNKTCLHCRQRGHSLKNCPEKAENADRKYCYNCGEAGHSLSNCIQPLQDGGTTYASCFICNEQGHLSKNCPQNTHGIYPKGGSCKICDGITHLAKDCPNKGSKSTVSASRVGSAPKKQVEQWQGKLTVFRSGDDLEDDFT